MKDSQNELIEGRAVSIPTFLQEYPDHSCSILVSLTEISISVNPLTSDQDMTAINVQPLLSPLILLVDDNEANIYSTASYLQAKGYRLVLAKNGWEAIEQTERQKPDLILMDIQMPGMDGLEAIRHIRANLVLGNIPIIALTALAMPGDRERCLAAGATDYLTKPIHLKQLVSIIQGYLVDREQ